MSDRRSYVALDWVNVQIAETLQQAHGALDGFIANPEDITKLRFALTYLHQVTGSLVMLELHAATLLSREMERLLVRVLGNDHLLQPQIEAAKLISPILPALTQYLDNVTKTHDDNPKELLALLNSVREANQQEQFSEADIFNPDIAIARQAEKQQPTIAVEEFNDLIRKLRQSFQTGLIGVVRDKDLENNYQLVSKVCASLLKVSDNTASEPLWQIAFAIADQLAQAQVPADIESKKALKQIDSQIKHLEEAGRDALSESPDAGLLKTLLYSVAKAETVTDAIAELRTLYQLDKALAESEAEPAQESPAVQKQVLSIIESIRQELGLIAGFDVVEMSEALVRLQNTFRILSISDLLANLQDIEQQINAVIDEGSDIASRAEPVCQQLEIIENFLQSWQDKKLAISFDSVVSQYHKYLAELRHDLDAIKQSLAGYVAGNCDKTLIQALPELLDRQLELLAISPLKRLVPVIQESYQYVVTQLLWQEKPPAPAALQALADAISSVDYYLERLPADSAENLQSILRVAEESIDNLHRPEQPLAEEIKPAARDEETYDDYSEIPAAAMAEDDDNLDIPVLFAQAPAANKEEDIFAITEEDFADEIPVANMAADDEFDLPLVVDEEMPESGSLPVAAVAEEGSAEDAAGEAAVEEDELIVFVPGEEADDEILEIFIEEAREVVEHIREYLPQLEADYNNMPALLEIRRSYHTLKGSGRMVGAMHVGDFAWSVERMLNGVRDGIAKVTDNCIAILHMATDFVPTLIDGLEQRSGVSKKMIRNIIDRADAEWEGKPFVAAAPVPAAAVAEPVPEAEAEEEAFELPDFFGEEEVVVAEEQPVAEEHPAIEEAVVEESVVADSALAEEEPIDEELLEIFLTEAASHIQVLSDYLDNIDPGYEDVKVSSELQRALHTLKGSSHMAGVNAIAILATPLEGFVKDLNNFQTTVDSEILLMLVRGRELLEAQISRLRKGDMRLIDGVESYIGELKDIHANRIEKHEEIALVEEGFADKYTALLSEALDCLTHAADLIQEWQSEGIEASQREALVDYLNRLSTTAREAKYQEIADLSAALADYYSDALQAQTDFDEDFFMLANKAHDELDDMMNIIAAHQIVDPATDLIEELQRGLLPVQPQLAAEPQKPVSKTILAVDTSQLAQLREQVLAADADTLEIFTEEASELLEALDSQMQAWFDNHKDRSGLGEIKRNIHTLKGGARLTELKVLADLAHAYESCIETAEANDNYDDAFFAMAESFQNQIACYIEYIVSGAYKQAEIVPIETALIGVDEAGEETIDAVAMPDMEETPVIEPVAAEMEAFEAEETLAGITGYGGDEAASEFDEAFEFAAEDYSGEESEALAETFAMPAEDEAPLTEPVIDEAEETPEAVTEFGSDIASEFDDVFEFAAEDYAGAEAAENEALADIFAEESTAEIPTAFTVDELETLEEIPALSADETFAEETFAEEIPSAFAVDAMESLSDIPVAESGEDFYALEAEAETEFETAIEMAGLAATEEPAGEAAAGNEYEILAGQYRKADQDTLEIFLEEALELDAELEEAVSEWLSDHEAVQHAASLKRILHTLKGGARLAELSVLGDLTHNYESMIEHAEARRAFDSGFFAGLQGYLDQLHQMIEFIANGARVENIPASAMAQAVVAAPVVAEPEAEMPEAGFEAETEIADVAVAEEPVAEAEAGNDYAILAAQFRKADQDTLEIFLEEALELDASLEEAVSDWLGDRETVKHADAMKRILHTLKGGARLAELSVLGDLTHHYESMIEAAEARKAFNDDFFATLQNYHDQVHRMIDFIANGAKATDIPAAATITMPAVTAPAADIIEQLPVSAALVEDAVVVTSTADDIDNELLALFVEEAREQNEGIEECIANFLKDPADIAPLDELKRLLHTLKGGARLTGIREIGDVSHDFETFIINSEREKKVNAGAFVDEMQAFHDKLTKLIDGINISAAPQAEEEKKPESNVVPIRPGVNTAADVNAALVSQAAIDATRAFIDNFNKDQQRANREPVKITPDLLEDLINLAGESSIGRSRIEEQMNEIVISQGEMDATVDRLHNQLRRLEIETEAQIVFRQEQVVSEGQENFDPLEMDRYTHMQQLSKSLIESASDLDDISATFTNKMRDMETLLLQQARLNTELQEGLMRCQMVPFSRMVPRLRRIVRQVAQELGKKVEFDVENAEGELDRTILERMVAPLEHMLRNAVDHGIEMPDVRKAAGKPAQGTIILALNREGGEIVLSLRDDGAGVNIAAVRKKAIERGLMTEDATLTDHELSQFILHAGFSTAQKVTQISGRGVGMDVVHSEIKQMGGSLDINSRQGAGSTFTVRLPFTVSVNRALMVVVGTDTYAIPLNTIEGIVRVSPYELEAYYQPDAPMFEYAGQSYHLRYMGSLLHRGHRAKLEGLTTPLPVVLIRSSDYTVAVQVDKLLGSREVVVKSLGPQFGMVGGLSGATVLGDGSVVIILDMLSLIRADFALGLSQAAARAEEYVPEVVRKVTTVMVVDDSVTVRKVTSRLLERFGLNVILAKDGLDALTQLQEMEELPDVMLLDIEMPRMDGFEVVSRVRHDTRLQHIPITMITSRTGDKHRERAISLGANRYLGKPFQERELLQTISELTGAEIQQA